MATTNDRNELLAQRFRRSERRTRTEQEAASRKHLKLLDDLDVEYGKPSPEDAEAALNLLADLSRGRP